MPDNEAPPQFHSKRKQYPAKDPILLYEDTQDPNSWYYPYFYYASAKNIINGKTNPNAQSQKHLADPNAPTLYSEAAKILFYSVWGR